MAAALDNSEKVKLDSKVKLDNFEKFKLKVMEFCENNGFSGDGLTEAHLEQMYTNRSAEWDSPEITTRSPIIGGEPKRAVLRHQRLRLLLLGGEEAYKLFTAKQPGDVKLTRTAFNKLHEKFSDLDEIQINVLYVSSVLKLSSKMVDDYKKFGQILKQDSEEALSQVAELAANEAIVDTPALNVLAPTAIALLPKLYPKLLHMRHLMFAEASPKEAKAALEAFRDATTKMMSQMRWLVDLFGFDRNNYGLTEPLYQKFKLMINAIDNCALSHDDDAYRQIMPDYLAGYMSADHLNLDKIEAFSKLKHNQKILASVLLAYLETPSDLDKINIVSAIQSSTISEDVANLYPQFLRNDAAKAPTYLPGILKTALTEFTRINTAAKGKCKVSPGKVIQQATNYTLASLLTVYNHIKSKPAQIVSCRDAAWEINWQKNNWAQKFINGKLAFSVNEAGQLQTTDKKTADMTPLRSAGAGAAAAGATADEDLDVAAAVG